MKQLIWKDTRDQVKAMADAFVSKNRGECFVLGANAYGSAFKRWFQGQGGKVLGFINDPAAGGTFEQIPVVRLDQVPSGSALVNCIVEGRAIQARDNLMTRKPSAYVDYFALKASVACALPEVQFMEATGTIEGDRERYESLFDRLADDLSRSTLQDLLTFRWNRDVRALEAFSFRLDEQYFEPFIRFQGPPAFVDGGGFDGGTTKLFHAIHPEHGPIYYFEPNRVSFERSKVSLKEVDQVRFFQKGLWHKDDVLHFDSSLGSASKVSEEGGSSIEVTSIDAVVEGPVHFIKLDIEGAEQNALRGAERTIRRDRPIIAVCVYHDQQDFWKVPELVLGIEPSYQVYLRHYTQGVFETVMYFV